MRVNDSATRSSGSRLEVNERATVRPAAACRDQSSANAGESPCLHRSMSWASELAAMAGGVRARSMPAIAQEGARKGPFLLVRPAGRTYLEVKVLYTPGKGKC